MPCSLRHILRPRGRHTQVYNLRWCGDAVDEYSKATGVQFDQVIKSRPDVAFVNPIDPHCKVIRELDASAQNRGLNCLPAV